MVTRHSSARTDHRWHGALAVLVLAATLLLTPAPASAGVAATAWASVTLPGGGNAFDNYDYTSKSRSSYNVDWAVDLLWTDNATVDKTSAGWSKANPGWVRGSAAYAWVNGVWDSNDGLKQYSNGSCTQTKYGGPHGNNYHYRVYAPPSTDRMYSTSYGYFVIGTAHNDLAENCGVLYAQTNDSEAAESYVAHLFAKNGYTVHYNAINLHNLQDVGCDYPSDGIPHCWDNNGEASQIVTP